MGKKLFEPGKTYEFVKNDTDMEPIEGEFEKVMKNTNGAKFAVFKRGTRTWWIPEMYWKYIKKITNK